MVRTSTLSKYHVINQEAYSDFFAGSLDVGCWGF